MPVSQKPREKFRQVPGHRPGLRIAYDKQAYVRDRAAGVIPANRAKPQAHRNGIGRASGIDYQARRMKGKPNPGKRGGTGQRRRHHRH